MASVKNWSKEIEIAKHQIELAKKNEFKTQLGFWTSRLAMLEDRQKNPVTSFG